MGRRKAKSGISTGRRSDLPSKRVRVATPGKLKTMKRDSQLRDRKLVAKDGAVDEMFLIGPDLARNAKVTWPTDG
jgi:hypothetical protein